MRLHAGRRMALKEDNLRDIDYSDWLIFKKILEKQSKYTPMVKKFQHIIFFTEVE